MDAVAKLTEDEGRPPLGLTVNGGGGRERAPTALPSCSFRLFLQQFPWRWVADGEELPVLPICLSASNDPLF